MKNQKKIFAGIFIILLVIPVAYFFFYSQGIDWGENNDTIPPEITAITGNIAGFAGQSTTITAVFSDDTAVTSAELFYRSASETHWNSTSILSGNATIILPANSQEDLFYYIIVDDAAGNGPVGTPSIDGSLYYIITVLNPTDGDNNNGNDTDHDSTGYSFLELPKPKFSCSECPKIAAMVDELYNSGDYPFYYVTLPEENDRAAARIKEYNVWGFPTIYIDGGYDLIVGSTVQKSTISGKILAAAARQHANLSVKVTAELKDNSSEITLRVIIYNPENQVYTGQLRVYLTEIVSTAGQGNAPTRFSLITFLINEEVEVLAEDTTTLTRIDDISAYDAENLMIFAVVFNAETHIGYSQPPDKNQFNAHYVDAVDATTVVEEGNLPPEVGIQTPSAKYLYCFGKQIRKTLTGNTILLGRTTFVVYTHDDSKIEKVEFYVDGALMKTVTEEPYEWFWHQFTIGKRTITVKAFDDQGKTSSATIDVIVFMKWPSLFFRTR